jgi:hypothetical protein
MGGDSDEESSHELMSAIRSMTGKKIRVQVVNSRRERRVGMRVHFLFYSEAISWTAACPRLVPWTKPSSEPTLASSKSLCFRLLLHNAFVKFIQI